MSEIGVIGAGLMGMALARRVASDGHRVTVLEASDEIGGLATWQRFGEFDWDRFYHVILPSDRELIGLIKSLGLESELEWQRTFTGFYVDEKLHSISSNMEFLKFPLLSLFSKARLAWTMLYGSRVNDWRRLEKVSVEDWLVSVSGRKTYEVMWKPLLLAKLGPSYRRVSAVFIWSYIKRLFSARDSSASAEHLGHVRGGYKQIFERLAKDIASQGGQVKTSAPVSGVNIASGGGINLVTSGEQQRFDKVICTSPVSVLEKIVPDDLINIDKPDGHVEYLGVICMVLVTRSPIAPFYVVNIADEQIPFTGLIGMSSVVSPKNTGGYCLTYLPKYMLSTDDEFAQDDKYFESRFLAGLKRMAPNFDHSEIVSVHINRARKVQPLQVLNYSNIVPQAVTKNPDFFVLNTSQFVNATLNNNEVVAAVNRFYDQHKSSLEVGA